MIRRQRLMDPWRETFVVQARLHDVPGSQIGDALAEVDAHCADSGQSPQEAFGDPVSYARSLARELAPGTSGSDGVRGGLSRRVWTAALNALAVLSGLLCLLSGVSGVAQGIPGRLTVGELVGILVGTLAIIAIGILVLRPGQRHLTGWLLLSLAIGFSLMVLPAYVWDRPVVEVSGWVLLVAGVLLLTLAWWPLVSGRLLADRVIDPRTGRDRLPVPRWAELWLRWGMPVTVVLVGVMLVLVIGYGSPS